MTKIRNFRDLEVWQLGKRIALDVVTRRRLLELLDHETRMLRNLLKRIRAV